MARVPYVESNNVRITLRYFDGEASVTTSLDEAPSIEVVRLVPDFDEPIVLEHGRGQVHYADGRKISTRSTGFRRWLRSRGFGNSLRR